MIDQASKLRNMVENKNLDIKALKRAKAVKIYSVVSGKGGVGKTNFSVNLAIKLQQSQRKVLIIDADIGMSNANILLGIDSPVTLSDMIDGDASLEDIIIEGPEGVHLISGGADLLLMESLDEAKQQNMLEALSGLNIYDIIIIDNGAGISKHSLTFSTFAHELILITTPEPTALTDAYRILKVNSLYKLKDRVKIVVNQVLTRAQGEEAFNKLYTTADKFLNVKLDNLGYIFNDSRMGKAIMSQEPIVLKYPKALASINIEDISTNILNDKNYEDNISNFREFGNRIRRFFG